MWANVHSNEILVGDLYVALRYSGFGVANE